MTLGDTFSRRRQARLLTSMLSSHGRKNRSTRAELGRLFLVTLAGKEKKTPGEGSFYEFSKLYGVPKYDVA